MKNHNKRLRECSNKLHTKKKISKLLLKQSGGKLNTTSSTQVDEMNEKVNKLLIYWLINKNKKYKFSIRQRISLAYWTFKTGFKLISELRDATIIYDLATIKKRFKTLAGIKE